MNHSGFWRRRPACRCRRSRDDLAPVRVWTSPSLAWTSGQRVFALQLLPLPPHPPTEEDMMTLSVLSLILWALWTLVDDWGAGTEW